MSLGRRDTRVLMLTIAVSAWAAFALLPATAGATFPGNNGRIGWAAEADVTAEGGEAEFAVLTVQPSGKREKKLVTCDTTGPVSCPDYVSFSPSGKLITWGVLTAGNSNVLVVAHADGTHRKTISHRGEDDFSPSFTRHGDRLLYVRKLRHHSAANIVTSDLSGGRVRVVITLHGDDPSSIHPEVAPSGQQILFIHHHGLWLASPQGKNARQLLPAVQSADFSPDGTKIVYVARNGSIHIVGANGAGAQSLGHSGAAFAVFSPDGQSIAFDTTDDGTGNPAILRMPATGGTSTEVDSFGNGNGGYTTGLAWQPRR